MEFTYLQLAILASILAAAGAAALAFYFAPLRKAVATSTAQVTDALTAQMQRGKSYTKIQTMLERKGGVFMFGAWATPLNYQMLRVGIGVVAFLLLLPLAGGEPVGLVICLALAVLATWAPKMILELSDESDNDAMLEDLKNLYNTLRIEAHAGVYLTQALSECYLVVKNKRLKSALLDLTNDILAKNDVETAIETFGAKFSNRYIDMFVVTIKQSLESGRSVQILSDVSTELETVQKAINEKIRESLERKLQIIQLLLYVGMLAIVLYALMTSLAGTMSTM